MMHADLEHMRMMSNLFDYIAAHPAIGAVALALLVMLVSLIAIAERAEGTRAE